MQYFVIGPDGTKYGPADVDTLKQWVAENRIGPATQLEDSTSAQRITAAQVPGLLAAAPVPQPTPPSSYSTPVSYPRQHGAFDDGSKDITTAYIFSALAVFCCPILFGILGIVWAGKAAEKGHPGANTARTVAIIALILGIIVGVGSNILLGGIFD